jgi:hypothetical protein
MATKSKTDKFEQQPFEIIRAKKTHKKVLDEKQVKNKPKK